MKHLYFFLLLFAVTACQTEGPLDDEMPLQAETRSDDESAPLVLYAQAQNIGTLNVGQPLSNYIKTFTTENMKDALMSLKWRRPINPTDGRLNSILDELVNFFPEHIKITHHYIVYRPKTMDDLVLLSGDSTLYLSSVPLDHEIIGSGTLYHTPSEYEPETQTTGITGSYTPLYTIIPISKPIPIGIEYEVLASLYMPHLLTAEVAEIAGTPFISATFGELLLEQAQYLSGYKSIDDLLTEKVWRPTGQIQVYDTAMREYVGVPNVKVHIYNNGRDVCALTAEDGTFKMPIGERDIKGPVSYSVEWGSNNYMIHNTAGELAYYYCGRSTNYPLNLKITDGEAYGIATMARALSFDFYDEGNPFYRVSDYTSLRLPCYYRHEYDVVNGYGGLFEGNGGSRITVWGLYAAGVPCTSKDLIGTTFHELGHVSMYLNLKRAGIKWSSYEKIIIESWAQFTGWYLVKAEYNRLGHTIFPRVQRSISTTEGLLKVYFDIPDWLNSQDMTQATFQSADRQKYYTPLFVDMMDDSNQQLWFRVNVDKQNIFPDDDIVIDDPVQIELIMRQCKTLASVKSYLTNNKNSLNITQDAINRYFTFYGI